MGDRDASESEVRRLCEAGEYDAATTLAIRTYGPEIMRFIHSRLRNEEAVSDAFSLFVEGLWRSLPRFDWRCSVRTWAYMLARQSASRARAVGEIHREIPLCEAPHVAAIAQQVRTETLVYLRTKARDRFEKLRATLSEADQTLLVLRVNRELDWRDIARILLYEGGEPSDADIGREAARLRKRFQLLKDRLRERARDGD
jgi:RNA polymerase sigma-70 factor (ECF subfamily)